MLRSPHFRRIHERAEFARYFFPELDGITIRLGLAQKRGVLGWGSLDPAAPGIWVRPRRLEYFTIAHELTHLLQARNLVPRGERQCDLWALARSPMLIDTTPSYLKLPRGMRGRPLSSAQAGALCEAARRAIAAREAGERRYLMRFERELKALPGSATRVGTAAIGSAAAVFGAAAQLTADPPRAVANLFARLRKRLAGARS